MNKPHNLSILLVKYINDGHEFRLMPIVNIIVYAVPPVIGEARLISKESEKLSAVVKSTKV